MDEHRVIPPAFSMTDPSASSLAVDADSDAYVRRLTEAFVRWTPAQRAAFAGLVADRHRDDLRDYDDMRPAVGSATALEIIDVLWDVAQSGSLSAEKAEAFVSDLRRLGSLVDPDRGWCSDVWRAIDVLEDGLRSSATPARSGPLEVALASFDLPRHGPAVPIAEKLRKEWSRGETQTTARWLLVAIAAISELSEIDPAVVRTLRERFARLGAEAKAEARREAARSWTVAAAAAPRPPVAVVMPKPPKPAAAPAVRADPGGKPREVVRTVPRPEDEAVIVPEPGAPVIKMDVFGKTLALVCVEGTRYLAELDGERRRIRSTVTNNTMSEGGGGARGEPVCVESQAVDIAPLLECLARNADRTTSGREISLSLMVQWGHFRQNRFTTVSISIAADGAIEIDTVVNEQDDSYY